MEIKLWTTLDRLMTLSVIGASAAVVTLSFKQPSESSKPTESPIQILRNGPTLSFVQPNQLGRHNTSLTIVEFSDFECPFCGRYARDVYPDIKHEFVETGKIAYEFVNLPLSIHAHAEIAAAAGECAQTQSRFWEMHDRIFHNQANLSAFDLVQHAVAIGLNKTEFETCLSGDLARQRIQADRSEAQRLNVTSTPTFFIASPGGNDSRRVVARINGSLPYASFKELLYKLAANPVT